MEVVKIVKEFLNSLGLTGLAEYVALGLSLAGGGALWKGLKSLAKLSKQGGLICVLCGEKIPLSF